MNKLKLVYVPVGGPAPAHVLRSRHTKLARGMTRTLYRSDHKLNDTALRLSVRGSSDELGYRFDFGRGPGVKCRCCAQMVRGPYRLNDSGKNKLRIRRKYAATHSVKVNPLFR